MKEPSLCVNVAGVPFKNPVFTSSGTYGFGQEYAEFIDLGKLGAITGKGITMEPVYGNPAPRVAEIPSGMMNCIGLQGPGVEYFCRHDLPFMREQGCGVIVNVWGRTDEEYLDVIDRLADEEGIDIIEVNISCPNVKSGGLAIGTDPRRVEEITRACRDHARQPVMMKLSPNVTSIADVARAAEAGGADAISLINSLTGMKIDIERQTFVLSNKTGGMSGPAIRPLAVRMVYQAAQAVSIPIVGMGGIMTAADAIEFMLAGATAVSVGFANFVNPYAPVEIIDGIRDYLIRKGIDDINEIIGAVH